MTQFYEVYQRTYKDYVNAVAATVGGTSGVAVAALLTVPQNCCIRLERISVWSNSNGAPVFELFVGGQGEGNASANFLLDRSRRLDWTSSGKNNISDENHPPYFDEGEVPLFVWTSCSNGDICQATVQVAFFEKTPHLSNRLSHEAREGQFEHDQERRQAVVVPGSNWDPSLFVSDGDLEETPSVSPWTRR